MLSHKEIQQLLLADISLQVVVYLDRPHAYRGSGVDQITYLQRKETAHIGNDLVDREKHILCISLLDGLAVNIQMERNAVHISHTLQWDECPKNSRIIERLAPIILTNDAALYCEQHNSFLRLLFSYISD